MKWAGDNIIDHMLDTIRDWKTQSQQWEMFPKMLGLANSSDRSLLSSPGVPPLFYRPGIGQPWLV